MNNLRSSQLLVPFGIGQIVNFPKEVSMMICGVDLWEQQIELREIENPGFIDKSQLKIYEHRLQRLIGVDYFISPFAYKERGRINTRLRIPGVRFPLWHYCSNPSCGLMYKKELGVGDSDLKCIGYDNSDHQGCNQKLIPVRFIAVCQEGHIQDVPFHSWVHNSNSRDNRQHILKYNASSGSGNLGSVNIKCLTCNISENLQGIMNSSTDTDGLNITASALGRIGIDDPNITEVNFETNPNGVFCNGHKPWLGIHGLENSDVCNRHLKVLIRGASNVHYATIKSSIYVPDAFSKYIEEIKSNFDKIDIGSLPIVSLKPIIELTDAFKKNSFDIEKTIKALKGDDDNDFEGAIDETRFRYEEYDFYLNSESNDDNDVKKSIQNLDVYSNHILIKQYFSNVVLLNRLKETKAFIGFSRIEPYYKNNDNEKMCQLTQDGTLPEWLPATQVYGEGIFLEFNRDELNRWSSELGSNTNNNVEQYIRSQIDRNPNYELEDISPEYILMHTFSHLLMKRLSLNCGYGSSSLKERIYYSRDPETTMSGLLIYTSSGDSEGSMGGLVKQGKPQNLIRFIKEAIEDARWCSADPVCSDVGRTTGQGLNNINGAACHNCALMPETSCEKFNSLLDRSMIVNTVNSNIKGFFD